MTKYTPEDVKQVADFMRHAKDGRPFALLTGAGCSKAAGIPLADELLNEINTTSKFEPALDGLSEEDRKNYGRVMARLVRAERKDLLMPYLEKAKVNWAHIAIAAMMGAGYIARVLTFNFDNVLARACGICGLYPATYDFVTGASSSTDHIVSPSIIHLHGQGYGLSMLNSEDETKKHAEKLRPLLMSTMRSHPLLVVGYSGLADQVFPIINDEYNGEERLFWAGYRESPEQHINAFVAKGGALTKYLGGADADLFLVQLAQQLGCWPPVIFEKPIEHIRREIIPVSAFPISDGKEYASGLDVLAALRNQLDLMEDVLKTDAPAMRASANLMKGDYEAVIRSSERGENVPDDYLFDAFFQSGNDLAKKYEGTEEPSLFDAALEKYQAALKLEPNHFSVLHNWGNILLCKAKVKKSASLFDDAREKIEAALQIKPGEAYNMACLCALTGDIESAKKHLMHWLDEGTMPSLDHLREDRDLDSLRDLDWFASFLAKAEASKRDGK